MKQLVGVLASLLFVVGCASDRVIVDTKGIDERKYQADLAECEAFAEQINTPAEAAKGGAVGAVIGATVGAVIGDSRTAERGAAILGARGATKGTGRAMSRKNRVIRQCLKGRGYKVLG